MPRVDDAASGAGIHVPGVYRALLENEREHHYRYGETIMHEGRELQVTWVDPDDHSAGCFCRPRTLLDALEAGEPVTVVNWRIGGRGVPSLPPEWRPGRGHRYFLVSADDSVVPTESPVVDPIRPPSGREA
jgi:hypothetical protein